MYFDPGTGSMLIQILIGFISVIGAYFIGLRSKLFKKKNKDAPSVDSSLENTMSAEITDSDGFEDIDDD